MTAAGGNLALQPPVDPLTRPQRWYVCGCRGSDENADEPACLVFQVRDCDRERVAAAWSALSTLFGEFRDGYGCLEWRGVTSAFALERMPDSWEGSAAAQLVDLYTTHGEDLPPVQLALDFDPDDPLLVEWRTECMGWRVRCAPFQVQLTCYCKYADTEVDGADIAGLFFDPKESDIAHQHTQ